MTDSRKSLRVAIMKSLIVLLLTANALLLVAAAHVSVSKRQEQTECDEGVEQMLSDGTAAFTGKFLYETIKSKPNENTIMSAFSVLQPIAHLTLFAQGKTLEQMINTLSLQTKFNIRCVFPRMTNKLKGDKNVVLNVANKIFATDAYPLSKPFINDGKLVFDAEPESLNFNNPQAAANRINQWVEDKTNKRIKNIAKPDMFDDTTRLVLSNAIYFLGNWQNSFDSELTMDRPFHINKAETVNIPTMYTLDNFMYATNSNLDCKVLQMFYKGGDFSFVVFLPNKVDGLSAMLEKLQNSRNFYNAYHNTEEREVRVYLPKMKIESEFDLIPILKSAGIKDIFDQHKSNLTNILETYEPLYISSATQKAFGLVDEKGTEAAGATVLVVAVATSALLNPPPIEEFKADHPFAFYIMNKQNIIFSGAFVKN